MAAGVERDDDQLTKVGSTMSNPAPRTWPEWAPPAVIEMHQLHLAPCLEREAGSASQINPTFQIQLAETIETLCTDIRMVDIWSEIDRRASRADYHCDFAESITLARWPPFGYRHLTPAQFLDKRKQAAAAARKLRSILGEMGLDTQTVFPIIGAKAMSGPILFFTDGLNVSLSEDPREWALNLKLINKIMMDNHPGIGTWKDVLDRLAVSIETDGKGWAGYRKVGGEDDIDGRARDFFLKVGQFLRELCPGPLLVSQTIQLTEIFFPDANIDRDALAKSLQRRTAETTR